MHPSYCAYQRKLFCCKILSISRCCIRRALYIAKQLLVLFIVLLLVAKRSAFHSSQCSIQSPRHSQRRRRSEIKSPQLPSIEEQSETSSPPLQRANSFESTCSSEQSKSDDETFERLEQGEIEEAQERELINTISCFKYLSDCVVRVEAQLRGQAPGNLEDAEQLREQVSQFEGLKSKFDGEQRQVYERMLTRLRGLVEQWTGE